MDRSAFRRNRANGRYGGSLVSRFIYSVIWITSSLYHLFEMSSHPTTDIFRGFGDPVRNTFLKEVPLPVNGHFLSDCQVSGKTIFSSARQRTVSEQNSTGSLDKISLFTRQRTFFCWFFPIFLIIHKMFTICPLSTRKITRISKQCFRGPEPFFFEIRSEFHKLEQAMPLAVKKRKTPVLSGLSFPRFRLMGGPHTPLTETASLAAHRNRRFMQTGTR